MNATIQSIREIAKATRRICNTDGYGHQVVIWPDFSWSEATDANDQIGRRAANGTERPLASLRTPMTVAEVEQAINSALQNSAVRY